MSRLSRLILAILVASLAATSAPGNARASHDQHEVRWIIRQVAADHGLADWQVSQMLTIAGCETGWTFDPRSVGDRGLAIGLYQYHAAAWSETPYRDYSRFNARASANAAAWHWTHGDPSSLWYWCWRRYYGP